MADRTPEQQREIDLAWAAGLFEGEGSICMRSGRTRRGDNPGPDRVNMILTLTMCDEDIVRRFHRVVGIGSVMGPYRPSRDKPHYKSVWRWSSSGRAGRALITLRLWENLGERRRSRAAEVFAALDSNAPPLRSPMATHCPQGHAYDMENTMVNDKGHRHCRACRRAIAKRRYYQDLHKSRAEARARYYRKREKR